MTRPKVPETPQSSDVHPDVRAEITHLFGMGKRPTFEEYQKSLGDAAVIAAIDDIEGKIIWMIREHPEYAKDFRFPLPQPSVEATLHREAQYAPEFAAQIPAGKFAKSAFRKRWYPWPAAAFNALGTNHALSAHSRISVIYYLQNLIELIYPAVLEETTRLKRRKIEEQTKYERNKMNPDPQ